MKKMEIPYLPDLENLSPKNAGTRLRQSGAAAFMDCINWKEFPKKPEIVFYAGHTKKSLFLFFEVGSDGALGRFEEDLSPVYRDSCVEFFAKIPGNRLYTNLEFNCIGTCLGARQRARDRERVLLSQEELKSVKRHASLGKKAFGEKRGECSWNLALEIPFSLFNVERKIFPFCLEANFHACCDDAPEKYYLSWNPVPTPHPDFHRPEFFGILVFMA